MPPEACDWNASDPTPNEEPVEETHLDTKTRNFATSCLAAQLAAKAESSLRERVLAAFFLRKLQSLSDRALVETLAKGASTEMASRVATLDSSF